MKRIFFSGLILLFFLGRVVVEIGAEGQSREIKQNRGVDIKESWVDNDQGDGEWLPPGQEKKGESSEVDKGGVKKPSMRSETAKEQMSEVAKKVEEILTTEGAAGGIGEQVKEIAREQSREQVEMEGEYQKLINRGWIKRIIGPDYGAIKKLRKQMEKNQLRMRQLERLQNKLVNEGERQRVQEMIEALEKQSTFLGERIQEEEKGFSFLGWLFKLFT